MSMFSAILGVFRQGTKSFNLVERNILDKVISRLPVDQAAALRSRIAHVNLVQRLDGGRQVNCYEKVNGKTAFSAGDQLADKPMECVIASFKLETMDNLSFSGNVWLINGFLFSIEFSLPTEHLEVSNIRSLDVVLAHEAGSGLAIQ